MSLILGEVVRDYEKQCIYIIHDQFIKTMNDSNSFDDSAASAGITYTYIGKFLKDRGIYFDMNTESTVFAVFESEGDQFYLKVNNKKYPIFNVCWQ